MSGLAQELQEFQNSWRPARGQSCKVPALMSLMSRDDAAAFANLMASSVAGTDIGKMLRSWGDRDDIDPEVRDLASRISSDAIQRHRRGACQCEA